MAETAAGEVSAIENATEQIVTPWDVVGDEKGVDYEKLIRDFGCEAITPELLQRFQKVTGREPHHWLKRGFFFSHRDLSQILDNYEKKLPIYLYTGRGPSSGALHFGHLIPFMFTKWLQDVFKCPLVIQLTNDEKYLWKDLTLEDCDMMTRGNAKDIIALGFDIRKTFIFSDFAYVGRMYPTVVKIQKLINCATAKAVFGFNNQNNIGQMAFAAIQAAPSFPCSFPVVFSKKIKQEKQMCCLIPCAIDQDPYFRVTRDVSSRVGYHKPSLIHCKFFPALQGAKSKMSSSDPNASIFVSDTPKEISNKINQHAFSGGKDTAAEQEKNGADLSIDVPYSYLSFFLDDDAELAEITRLYGSDGALKPGEKHMMTGVVKKRLIQILTREVEKFKTARASVTDEIVNAFMTERPLDWD